jgi:hypothetical protein
MQDSRHSMIPQCESKTLSWRFDRYECTRPTRNTTFLPNYLKMTFLSPLLRRKRRALTGRGLRDDLRDIPVARSRRFRFPQRCRFAPLFSAIFTFLGMKVVYPPANLGASCTNFQSRLESFQDLSHVFTAFRSFYTLETPIVKKT